VKVTQKGEVLKGRALGDTLKAVAPPVLVTDILTVILVLAAMMPGVTLK
jgi:hypothetical protein